MRVRFDHAPRVKQSAQIALRPMCTTPAAFASRRSHGPQYHGCGGTIQVAPSRPAARTASGCSFRTGVIGRRPCTQSGITDQADGKAKIAPAQRKQWAALKKKAKASKWFRCSPACALAAPREKPPEVESGGGCKRASLLQNFKRHNPLRFGVSRNHKDRTGIDRGARIRITR